MQVWRIDQKNGDFEFLTEQKSYFFLRFCQCAVRNAGGFLRSGGCGLHEIFLIGHESLVVLLHWAQLLDDRFGNLDLEVAVALAVEFTLDSLVVKAGAAGIDSHEVVYAVLAVGVSDDGLAVGCLLYTSDAADEL